MHCHLVINVTFIYCERGKLKSICIEIKPCSPERLLWDADNNDQLGTNIPNKMLSSVFSEWIILSVYNTSICLRVISNILNTHNYTPVCMILVTNSNISSHRLSRCLHIGVRPCRHPDPVRVEIAPSYRISRLMRACLSVCFPPEFICVAINHIEIGHVIP